jgi:hypothetical protein
VPDSGGGFIGPKDPATDDGTYWRDAPRIAQQPGTGSFPGELILSLTTPGATEWTVPDLNGDGSSWRGQVDLKAGGGGGGWLGSAEVGGGGGEGERIIFIQDFIPGDTFILTVGAGGARSTADSAAGVAQNGFPTSFGSLFTASGGYRGRNADNPAPDDAEGGQGGGTQVVVTNTLMRIPGMSGFYGTVNVSDPGGNGGGQFGGVGIGSNGDKTEMRLDGLSGCGGAGRGSASGRPVSGNGGPGYTYIWRLPNVLR